MTKRLLTLMCILAAAPVAAQGGDVAGAGDMGGEGDTAGAGDMGGGEVAGAGDYQDPVVEETVVEEVPDETSPVAYTHRSLTIPEGMLRIDAGPSDRAMNQRGGFSVTGIKGSDANINLHIGGAFGIIDGLEAGAVVLPLTLAPSGGDTYTNPSVYARYRILDGDFQLGGQVRAVLPIQDGTDFGLQIGVPIKLVLGEGLHLNTGLELMLRFADPDMIIGLNVPVEFAYNITEAIFFGIATGLIHPDFDNGDPYPLGIFAGYTLAMGSGMMIDATVDFGFPGFLGFADGYDNPNADVWQLIIGGVVRMDLL